MNKLKRKDKVNIVVKTGTIEEFFSRGKLVAKILDAKKHITPTRVIIFEDSEDLVRFLTKTKIALLSAIRNKPASITALAKKLHRSRAAVDRDVKMLESVGIVESSYISNPGHGRCRIVTTDGHPIKLRVEATL